MQLAAKGSFGPWPAVLVLFWNKTVEVAMLKMLRGHGRVMVGGCAAIQHTHGHRKSKENNLAVQYRSGL